MIQPERESAQFLRRPIRPAMIYPTVYVTKEEFDKITLPPFSRRFVVIRDLRDTLVSLYFSIKISHPLDTQEHSELRSELVALSAEDGLLRVLDLPDFHKTAAIQRSWQQSGEPLIRYEELLQRDEEVIVNLFLHQCGLPIDPQVLRNVVRESRFEALTGRRLGQEEIHSHYRKGVAGDWHNHFTERVSAAFKERFGAILVATGYEQDFDWRARAATDKRFSPPSRAANALGHEYTDDLRFELERRLALINRLNTDLKRAQTDCNEKERLITDLRNALARVSASHDELQAEYSRMEREFHSVMRSRSWQITSPLRIISAALRRFARDLASHIYGR